MCYHLKTHRHESIIGPVGRVGESEAKNYAIRKAIEAKATYTHYVLQNRTPISLALRLNGPIFSSTQRDYMMSTKLLVNNSTVLR